MTEEGDLAKVVSQQLTVLVSWIPGAMKILKFVFLVTFGCLVFGELRRIDTLLFPALQVLAYLEEANWKTNETYFEMADLRGDLFREAEEILEERHNLYTEQFMDFLAKSSETSAKWQLVLILEELLKAHELEFDWSKRHVRQFLKKLKNSSSELSETLEYTPPLIYN